MTHPRFPGHEHGAPPREGAQAFGGPQQGPAGVPSDGAALHGPRGHRPVAPRPPLGSGPHRPGAGVVAKEILFMVLGIVFGFSAAVFPWAALNIRRARRSGRAPGVRWLLGAMASAGITVVGTAFLTWLGLDLVAGWHEHDPAVGGFMLTLAGVGMASLASGALMIATARPRPGGAPGVRPGAHPAASLPGAPSGALPRGRTAPGPQATAAGTIDGRLFDDSEHSRRVEAALRTLSSYVPLYAGYHMGGRPVGDRIAAVVGEAHELIRRLDSRGAPQQVRLAKAQYADTLEKIVAFTGPDYLKDVIDNPRLWHHPQRRVAEVAAALDAVSEQVVENIRQVNSSQDLNFQVALRQLQAITGDDEFAALYAAKGQAR